jgi:choline dehydrogenase-like flavoprotein
MDADVIIVGSGAAGAAAALGLAEHDPLVVDVGNEPPPDRFAGSLEESRESSPDLHDGLIGPDLESLHNVFFPYLSPKLKAPLMRFIWAEAASLTPLESSSFHAVISLALGGLANAWGAGTFRFISEDLDGFPIGAEELDPHYDLLTREIGISGADDDLGPCFGSTRDLLPPLRLPALFSGILGRYVRRNGTFLRKGLRIGRPRIAVLSEARDGRPAYEYDSLDFFQSGNPAIYTPSLTIQKLVHSGKIRYRNRILVRSFDEDHEGVTVHGLDLDSTTRVSFRCRKAILAAGALNTARIVLESRRDYRTTLPILDNAVSYIPLLDPRRIGVPDATPCYPGAVLNAIYKPAGASAPLQMSLYAFTGTLRSDFLFDFPFASRDVLPASRVLLPALLVAQLFFPSLPHPANRLTLDETGRLRVEFPEPQRLPVERRLLSLYRRLGLFGHPTLVRHLSPGSSFHYAGCLPMTRSPSSPYETGIDGKLAGTRAVFIADAAVFPRLPSKNHTFTVMANAHRVASGIAAAPG